jgi:thioredoxin reductase (NADPH)
METLIENLISYIIIGAVVFFIIYFYMKNNRKNSEETAKKIQRAKESGLYEPITLHPVVNSEICIGSGACIKACPEKDILGLVNGKAQTINASRCVGHGACFHACPVQAISLCIGTEKRGVELPHVSPEFETNIPGIYIAGEIGGMGLIKNAVEQGRQAVEYFCKKIKPSSKAKYDLVIVGAGPAGVSASLTAAKNNLRFVTLEQDSLGGTVFSFPRAKIVMTSPMNLPLFGKIKLNQTTKSELLELWKEVLQRNKITINEHEKVELIQKLDDHFLVKTNHSTYTSKGVLLAIGRRGTPRKLGIPGEEREKVYYRLLEPEIIHNQNILVVGGGDSAVESAMLLADENNKVTLSYRGESFSRIKPSNLDRIKKYSQSRKINVILKSEVLKIDENNVLLKTLSEERLTLKNDLVYIFAGGELPTKFLEQVGIKITKKFGDAVLKHD